MRKEVIVAQGVNDGGRRIVFIDLDDTVFEVANHDDLARIDLVSDNREGEQSLLGTGRHVNLVTVYFEQHVAGQIVKRRNTGAIRQLDLGRRGFRLLGRRREIISAGRRRSVFAIDTRIGTGIGTASSKNESGGH